MRLRGLKGVVVFGGSRHDGPEEDSREFECKSDRDCFEFVKC